MLEHVIFGNMLHVVVTLTWLRTKCLSFPLWLELFCVDTSQIQVKEESLHGTGPGITRASGLLVVWPSNYHFAEANLCWSLPLATKVLMYNKGWCGFLRLEANLPASHNHLSQRGMAFTSQSWFVPIPSWGLSLWASEGGSSLMLTQSYPSTDD